jgi:hypothetical protein
VLHVPGLGGWVWRAAGIGDFGLHCSFFLRAFLGQQVLACASSAGRWRVIFFVLAAQTLPLTGSRQPVHGSPGNAGCLGLDLGLGLCSWIVC